MRLNNVQCIKWIVLFCSQCCAVVVDVTNIHFMALKVIVVWKALQAWRVLTNASFVGGLSFTSAVV